MNHNHSLKVFLPLPPHVLTFTLEVDLPYVNSPHSRGERISIETDRDGNITRNLIVSTNLQLSPQEMGYNAADEKALLEACVAAAADPAHNIDKVSFEGSKTPS
jgi:hypothetical protein